MNDKPDDPIAAGIRELDALAERARQYQDRGDTGTDIMAVGGTAEQRRDALVSQRTEIEATRMAIQQQAASLRAELERATAAALAELRPMQERAELLSEGIAAVELFLGVDEYVELVRDGEPAPADTPITVRQLVLGMDEECSITKVEGGIDSQTIDLFLEWLKNDPAHLHQVLPEAKGVVALRPRGTPKNYKNPWEAIEKMDADVATWLLIRNGEILYLYAPEGFNAGNVLIPRRSEFEDLFTKYDPFTKVRTKLQPGTSDWEAAEKAAGKRQRHYMKAALILEGLLTRTAVFHPITPGASFVDPDSYDRGLTQVIMDGDMSLSDPRESFREWQKRMAAELRPGMRVIGDFGWDEGWRQANEIYKDDRPHPWKHSRMSPVTGKEPFTGVMYQIEERRKNGDLIIRYGAGREIWSADLGYHEAKRRISATLRPTDQFVLPYDLIDRADIERFLGSRLERKNYLGMVPILKAARRLQIEEAETEAPFRLMLTGIIASRNKVDVADVEAELDDLVSWWKFRRRDHRPLVGDQATQAEAVDAIVAEHAARAADRAKPINQKLVDQLATGDVLMVARRRDGKYVTFTPTEGSSVYVTLREYGVRGKQSGEDRPWLIVGNRTYQWQVLWTSPAWSSWPMHASPAQNPTGPQRAEAAAQVEAAVNAREAAHSNHDATGATVVAVTYDRQTNTFVGWRYEESTHDDREGHMAGIGYHWQCVDGVTTTRIGSYYGHRHAWVYSAGMKHMSEQERIIFHQDEMDRIEAVIAERAATAAERRAVNDARGRMLTARTVGFREQWEADVDEIECAKFVERYGDASLWPGHRKTVRFPAYPYSQIRGWADSYLDEYGDPAGLTVAEVAAAVGGEGKTVLPIAGGYVYTAADPDTADGD